MLSIRIHEAMAQALHYLSIIQAADLIQRRELSPTELTRALLDRIDALNPTLRAFITVTAETALEQARQAEKEWMAGRSRGLLHGIPIAYKDNIATAGIPTTCHSRLLSNWIPARDATVVRRLAQAGCVCLGKLSLHEFAYGSPSADQAYEPARNPWSTTHAPGASSSGAGAAVAAGLAMGAVGTDTGGSIRNPAAACGVVGMKATFGLVSNHGVIPLSPTQDHTGPMTRTVSDNRLMLAAMAGFDRKDPDSIRAPWSMSAEPDDASLGGTRIGVPFEFLESIPVPSDLMIAFQAALELLADHGAIIVPIALPGIAEANAAGALILLLDAYRFHRENLERYPECFGTPLRTRVLEAARYSEADYVEAVAQRRHFVVRLDRLVEREVDVIVTPTSEGPPQAMAALLAASPTAARGACTRMFNISGMPALAVPMGLDPAGLPRSLQIAGRRLDEATLYRVAAAYESANDWSSIHPPL